MIKVFVNNEEAPDLFTLSNFPGGEPHAKLNRTVANMGDKIDIILKGADLNEYAQVLMMCNLLDKVGCTPGVFVPYLGGARADHDATEGWYPYALMASKFPNLTIADVHSDVNLDFFEDIDVVRASQIVSWEMSGEYDIVIAPDAGATPRASSVARMRTDIIGMEKTRDQETGRITSYDFSHPVKPARLRGKKALVVDDICDGGMTFGLLAESLSNSGLEQLDLYVTHGIFSGNAKENLALYDNIYTTNSLETANNVDATIIDLERIYLDNSGPIPN